MKDTTKVKKELVDYLGGKCKICGYDKCVEALQFYNLDPALSNPNYCELIKEEIDKCILLCGNCYSEHHAGVIDVHYLIYYD